MSPGDITSSINSLPATQHRVLNKIDYVTVAVFNRYNRLIIAFQLYVSATPVHLCSFVRSLSTFVVLLDISTTTTD